MNSLLNTVGEVVGIVAVVASIFGSIGILIYRTGKTVAMVEKHDTQLNKLEAKVDKILSFLSQNIKLKK
ncbi:MAG TPA: hypothetical protein VK508_22415 [Cyclobacteriaceae bacterium]|nr:hypothetical protein [Cyclobacteriaceae bacterium]